jgi:DNA-binding response OmpR family regulator
MAEITVIEDSYEIARLVQLALGAKGHKVTTYHDGLDGLEAVLAKPPVLLISDVNLPGMNGFEVTKHVREKHGQRLGILMLTSRTDLDSRIEGLSYADDYLGKPFELRELTARVEALVRRYAAAAAEAVAAPIAPASSAGNLRASLETVGGAIAALQMVSVTQSAGGIVIEGQGTIYLADGKVVHAQMGTESGNSAAMKLLSLNKGAFFFDVNLQSQEKTMNADPMMLMLDVSRYMDEINKPNHSEDHSEDHSEEEPKASEHLLNGADPYATLVNDISIANLEATPAPNKNGSSQPSGKASAPSSAKSSPPSSPPSSGKAISPKDAQLDFDLGLNDSFELLARSSGSEYANDHEDSFELAPEDILEPIDLDLEGVIIMPSIEAAMSLMEEKGLVATERQDIETGDICLILESQGILLAVLHKSLLDFNNR